LVDAVRGAAVLFGRRDDEDCMSDDEKPRPPNSNDPLAVFRPSLSDSFVSKQAEVCRLDAEIDAARDVIDRCRNHAEGRALRLRLGVLLRARKALGST
jgi:hypothetical protein